MWMVKISLIMYMFSAAMIFGGYYVNEASGLGLFSNSTYDALNEIMTANEVADDEEINVDLIFGDFLAGARAILGVLTLDIFSEGDAFTQLPNMNETWMILIRFLYTTTAAFFWVYMIAGRVI